MKYIDKEYIKNEINLAEHFLKEYNKDDKIVCVGGGMPFIGIIISL